MEDPSSAEGRIRPTVQSGRELDDAVQGSWDSHPKRGCPARRPEPEVAPSNAEVRCEHSHPGADCTAAQIWRRYGVPPLRTDLAARLARRLPGLRPLVVERLAAEVPAYAHLPPGVLHADITDTLMASLHTFARLLLEDRDATPEDLEPQIRSAERRAEERIPLLDALTAYHVGFGVCWDHLSTHLEPGDSVEEVARISRAGLRFLQGITTAVADAYLEASTSLQSREREARQTLLDLALEGRDQEENWLAASLTPWPIRTVLHLRHPAPDFDDAMTRSIEARRQLRRTREALADLTGTEVLDALTPVGGAVLLCGATDRPSLTTALAGVLPDQWWCGVSTLTDQPPGALLDAAHGARDCAHLAQRLSLAPGLYAVPELMVELQVTRAGPARDALVAVLAPLAGYPELTTTLRTYLSLNAARTDTAALLHIHPNTLDNRLRRIRDLTGVDLTDRAGFELARAASTASTFVAASPPAGL